MGLLKGRFFFKKLWHKVAAVHSMIVIVFFLLFFISFEKSMIKYFEVEQLSENNRVLERLEKLIDQRKDGQNYEALERAIEEEETFINYGILAYDRDGRLLFGDEFYDELLKKNVVNEKTERGIITEAVVNGKEYDYWVFKGKSAHIDGSLYLIKNIDQITGFYEKVKGFSIIFAGVLSCVFIILSFLSSKWLLFPIFEILEKARNINVEESGELLEVNYSEEELKKIIELKNDFIGRIRNFVAREKRFVSNASHELLTPITVIRGYTEVLRWGREDDEVFKGALDSIEGETERMEELIEGLMTLSKIESMQGKGMAYLNMEELVRKEGQRLEGIYERVIHIKTEKCFVEGNEILLKNLVGELVKNAAKYSDSQIDLEVSAKGENVVLKVRDRGRGMSQKYLEKIFHRFSQEDISKEEKGFGLGMAIVKEISTLHRGLVDIESTLGKGTVVKIVIPKLKEVLR